MAKNGISPEEAVEVMRTNRPHILLHSKQWYISERIVIHTYLVSVAPVVLFAETDFTSKTGYFFDPIRYSSETGSSALIISMGYFVYYHLLTIHPTFLSIV